MASSGSTESGAPDAHPDWQRLLDAALAYPEAYLDHPWGENVVKVRGKIFVFFGMPDPKLFVGVKLPESRDFALMQPYAGAFGYNMDRAGWVRCEFGPDEEAPFDILLDWLHESYRAVAPKKLSAGLAPRR